MEKNIFYKEGDNMDDKCWFMDHLNEIIRDHKDKFVSVLNGKIIAVGDNIEEIKDKIMALKRNKKIKGIPYTGKAAKDYAVIHFPSIPTWG